MEDIWSNWCLSNDSGDEVASLATLAFSWYYAFGLHFCESHLVRPRMDSTRIYVLFLWLYTMILTIVYSTNLTAFLLVQKPAASMETIRELYISGREMSLICQGLTLSIAKSSDPNVKVCYSGNALYCLLYELILFRSMHNKCQNYDECLSKYWSIDDAHLDGGTQFLGTWAVQETR